MTLLGILVEMDDHTYVILRDLIALATLIVVIIKTWMTATKVEEVSKKVIAVKEDIHKVELATNGMKHELVEAVRKASFAAGVKSETDQHGKARTEAATTNQHEKLDDIKEEIVETKEEVVETKEIAKDIAKEITKGIKEGIDSIKE